MEISVFLSFLPFCWWNWKRISPVTYDRLAVDLLCHSNICYAGVLHRTDVVFFVVKVHVRIVLFCLEPTDVLIVGMSQSFAEMFYSFKFICTICLVVFKQVWFWDVGSKIEQSVLLWIFLRSIVFFAILFCVVQNKSVCKAIFGVLVLSSDNVWLLSLEENTFFVVSYFCGWKYPRRWVFWVVVSGVSV